MDYEQFEILIQSKEGGQFEARVVKAPFHETPRVVFPRPLPLETVERLQALVEGDEEKLDTLSPRDRRRLPIDAGLEIYEAVFGGEIGELFNRCHAALGNQDKGLRIRLRFLLNDQEIRYLAALPWELLRNPKSHETLTLDIRTPVIRDFDHPHQVSPLEDDPPLRLLIVDAEPQDKDFEELDLELEIGRMKEALEPLIEAGKLELLRLSEPSLQELRWFLRDHDVHAIHFMGHAGYDQKTGFGAIFLTDADRKAKQVDGEMIATTLKSTGSLRLLVLNACKTARHAGRLGAPFYFGVASAVIERTGVPAVVAHQYAISDTSAVRFSHALYSRLAAGDPIDTALTEARIELRDGTREWNTPVLFMSSEDGKIFDFTAQPTPHAAAPHVAKKARPEPLHLGVRSRVGWGQDMEEQADQTLDLTDLFHEDKDRYIRDPQDWNAQVFPRLRTFLLEHLDEGRPLLLDFAAHASIAFAAGWVLEAKSGLDVRVRQRTAGELVLDWHPSEGPVPEGPLWLDRPDLEIDPDGTDVALGMSVSQPTVAEQARDYVERKGLAVRRVVDAVIAPEPGPRSVEGGAHALRLAQTILPRLRQRHPSEREGRVHLFCAAPNALMFYLGQLSPSLEWMVLYEYAFQAQGSYGRYQQSIELPPPGERTTVPEGW